MNITALSKKIGEVLRNREEMLATAESCTGGWVGHCLTQIPGSSDYYLGGVISYSNQIKREQLKVSEQVLQKHGAVSSVAVLAMAQGVRRQFKADIALAVSGIAGPTGGTKVKPVGLIFLGLSSQKHSAVFKKIFKGSRSQIKKQAAEWGLKKLLGFINGR